MIWLSGVRRVGKTFLCRSLPRVAYFDCELPRIRRELQDPEAFLAGVAGKRVVLDEIHPLPHPTELLKIATDHFPDIRIIATGSSTLGATTKFRDTLTGRKREDKLYHRHSGYPGSLRSVTAGRLLETHPERVIEAAVRGMLPKGPLGRRMGRKLKVYAGPEHPHAAQQPKPLEIGT